MPTAENKKLRIAVVGAGIGGLTLSAAIEKLKGQRDDIEVDIYEASSQLSEVGAGINFWPRTWDIMQKLGLDQQLLSVLPHIPTSAPRQVFQFRKGDQPEGVYITTAIMEGGSYRFHRADVQRALLNAQTTRLHLSHRLVTYDEKDDEIHLQFEGGVTAVCHLLVGMDGIKSTVRKRMLTAQGLRNSSSMHPMWSGDIAYRSLIPVERLEAEYPGHRTITTPMIYAGKSKHLVTYPVSQDKLVNLVAFTADPSGEGIPYDGPTTLPCSQEEILSNFKLWEPEAQALFRCMEKPTKWVIRFLHPLDSYASGRVVLGGDAAHAMAPHQGSGAGQAIEDAYVLANLLCDEACTKETVLKVAEIYDKVRRPFGNAILEKSRLTGRIGQFLSPGLEDIVEGDDKVPPERLRAIIQEYIDSLEWVWKESAETDKERALSMLQDLERKTS